VEGHLGISYNKGALFGEHQSTVLWSVGLSIFVSVLVALGSALYVTHTVKREVLHQTNAANLTNCHSIAKGRVTGDQFRFAVREELSFIPNLVAAAERGRLDRVTPAGRRFLNEQIVQLNKDLKVERRTIPGLPKHISTYGDLFGLLADQPLISCKRL
jgi:hypothetical protein